MFKLNTAEQFESFIFAAVPWHHNENRLPEQQQQSGVVKLHCSNIYHLCFAIQWHCNNIATLNLHMHTSVMPRLPSNDHPLPSGLRCPAQPSPSSSHLIFQSPNLPVLTNDPSSCQALGRISKQPPAGRVLGDEDVWVDKCAGSRCWENAVCRYWDNMELGQSLCECQ